MIYFLLMENVFESESKDIVKTVYHRHFSRLIFKNAVWGNGQLIYNSSLHNECGEYHKKGSHMSFWNEE
jgi:hypothetical protein